MAPQIWAGQKTIYLNFFHWELPYKIDKSIFKAVWPTGDQKRLKMTIWTLVSIPIIFDTAEKLFILVKNGLEGKIIFLAKN